MSGRWRVRDSRLQRVCFGTRSDQIHARAMVIAAVHAALHRAVAAAVHPAVAAVRAAVAAVVGVEDDDRA